jgi:acyl-CoA synthetase (AMP-forming)/AMP-acid ligase II
VTRRITYRMNSSRNNRTQNTNTEHSPDTYLSTYMHTHEVASGIDTDSRLLPDSCALIIVDPIACVELPAGSEENCGSNSPSPHRIRAVGEIWITGHSKAQGYWRKPAESKAPFPHTHDPTPTQLTTPLTTLSSSIALPDQSLSNKGNVPRAAGRRS